MPRLSIDRQVQSLHWKGKQARAIITKTVYFTDVQDLWEALVSPVRLRRWFGNVTGTLEEGGHYAIEGNAHGAIEVCKPPTHLALTWEFNGGIGWVNVTLEAVGESETQMILEHIAHEETDFLAFLAEFGPGAMGVGWDISLLGLSQHLASSGVSATFNENVWARTSEGEEFIRASSNAWADADVKFGTPEDVARTSGNKTYRFFRGGAD